MLHVRTLGNRDAMLGGTAKDAGQKVADVSEHADENMRSHELPRMTSKAPKFVALSPFGGAVGHKQAEFTPIHLELKRSSNSAMHLTMEPMCTGSASADIS